MSFKLEDPQFSGQTKERLSSRPAARLVSTTIKDAFTLWLNSHVADGEIIAKLAMDNAVKRQKARRKVARRRVTKGPALPGKLADCASTDLEQTETSQVERSEEH